MKAVGEEATKTWSFRLEGLSKAYDDNVLFQNLNLEIRPGAAIHVQGPNGSGKTQLMLVVAGLVEADAGQIRFRDGGELSLNRLGAEARAHLMRYVPYLPGGLSELPIARALLVMSRRLRPFSLYSQRAAAARLVSELEPELQKIANERLEIDRPLANYSIGQQKRFMTAASVGIKPHPILVMLDEPLAGLDADGITKVIAQMREVRELGVALLVSEHRKEIFNFEFDSVLRLPYRPGIETVSSGLISVQAREDSNRSKETETVLRASDVVAGYTGCPIYCPSISVSCGELVVINGPNGSGKTGFIRGLLGHSGTTLSGRLEFEEVSVPSLRQAQQLSALRYLSQKRDLFPDLTVQESITVASRGRKTELGKEIADIVRFLGSNKLVRHLSSGGRALLGLAQALAGGPRLLILDEPAANTDADNHQRVWELIDRVCRKGNTGVLVIEHDLIPAIGSTIYQIEQQGTSSILKQIAK